MNTPLPLDELLASWLVALKAERKRPATLRTYEAGVRLFLAFLAAEGLAPELTKANVLAYVASLADHSTATAVGRLAAIKRFARWLDAEEGFDATGVLSVRATTAGPEGRRRSVRRRTAAPAESLRGQRSARQARQGDGDAVRRDRAAGLGAARA